MRKLKRLWGNIPRRARIGINLLGIVVLAFEVYCFLGCPAFTLEQNFRRAEKANLVGPSEILAVYEPAGSDYEHLLVADDGSAVIFYLHSGSLYSSDALYYREKTGDLTVLAAPGIGYFPSDKYVLDLPIFVFDNYPKAVRAELEFTLSETVNDVYYERTFQLESDREEAGWFHFNIRMESESWYVDEWGWEHGTRLGNEAYLLYEFSYMCGYRDSFNLQPQPVAVRLYDEREELILDETVQVRCAKDMAHREREK
ncbi:MAG: hypothetical protein IJ375_02225 [Oscillospiraceae bacterium]|nr:hypothetical protein [Oscillospiraceae bacterium]